MKKLFYSLLVILGAGCKEKYTLPFEVPPTGYLVIEGVINTGPDSTYLEISRTNKINSNQKQYEKGAVVQLEGNDNSSFKFSEISTGRYATSFILNSNKQYRLRVKTLSGKEYLSDFVEVKITPPIDSVTWKYENNGVQLYTNTHDPQNKTIYYQWDYKETWEFHSPFLSVLKFNTRTGPNGRIIPYLAYKDSTTYSNDTTIFKCWRSGLSNQILIGSSARLSKDLIYLPLLFIPQGDIRLSVLYSINLKQYALTKNGFEFLEKMKKNTEETGSIFDPQPSALIGNIHCLSDPNEPVVGYLNISSIAQKRLFISKSQVPQWRYDSGCEEVKIPNHPDSIFDVWSAGWEPTVVLEFTLGSGRIAYFGTTTRECIDCTTSGTNIKPVFWP